MDPAPRSDDASNSPEVKQQKLREQLDLLRDELARAAPEDPGRLEAIHSEHHVFQLQGHLARLGKSRLGIVLKIETRRALENLPTLVWAAMRSEAVGVMIARGDLAVECGYERLAEVQEEIL